jgi:hypothetical protein
MPSVHAIDIGVTCVITIEVHSSRSIFGLDLILSLPSYFLTLIDVLVIAVLAGRAAVPRATPRRHPVIIHRRHHVPALEPETPNRVTVRLVRFHSVASHQVLFVAAHTVRPAVGAVVP